MPNQLRTILELCAGEGDITKQLTPAYKVMAVELLPERVRRGRKKAPDAEWIQADLESEHFYDEFSHTDFDAVVMNPPFKLGMYALSLASDFIRKNQCNRVIAILPSDYFVAKKRRQAYTRLKLAITKEFRIGNVAYIDGRASAKPRPDSIFVFKRIK